MSTGGLHIHDFLPIEDLMSFLGYTDFRSAFKWCKQHKIAVLKVGLKKYVKAVEFSQLIENQLINFEPESQIDKKENVRNQTFKAQNEIVAKYLSKYEKQDWSKASKRR
jgi:hypothetical protein